MSILILGVKSYGYISLDEWNSLFETHSEDEPKKSVVIFAYHNGYSYFKFNVYASEIQFSVDYYSGEIKIRSWIADTSQFTAWKTL